ncbi:MAG: S1C family serine protease [Candidatus Scalindua sp.]
MTVDNTKYSILLIIPLILLILLPVVCFADADRIFKENSKAVVVVTAYDEKGNAIRQGSGFIVRRDGAVVTNYHVISKARDIKVKAGDKVFDVEGLIFTDKENDLVILKVKAKDMPVVKLGIVEKANIGEHVYVISSPVGLENTISDGLLSGIRKIDEKTEILQITAPISPGSSGGPVFNINGEVIGVVTFLIQSAQNLNFAMPVKLIKDKISSKRVTAIKGSGLEDYEKTFISKIHGVQKIMGAFSVKLGDYFDPSSAIETWKLKTGYRDKYRIPIYQFNPKKKFRSFDRYFVMITPKTHKIYSIWGLGRIDPGGKDECEKEQALIMELLQKKYGSQKRHASTVLERVFEFAYGKSVDQGNRHVSVKCGSDQFSIESEHGTHLQFGYPIGIKYYDEELEKLAEKEQIEIEKERIEIESSKIDDSGL